MNRCIRIQTILSILLLPILVASFGCVSSGKFKDLEKERNALQSQSTELEEEVTALKSANQALATNLAQTEEEAAAMRGTYAELVGELQSEVTSGQIEIQQLVDGIQLNVSDQLLFASGSAALGEAGLAVIGRVGEQIKDERAIVAVEGHTDNAKIGPGLAKRYPTNWELAGARAASVVRHLAENGVPSENLRAVSRGPFDPIASNDTAEGRARNRRTEIILRVLPE